MRLKSQSGVQLSLGDSVATQGGLARSGRWCVWVTMGAGAPPSETCEAKDKIGTSLIHCYFFLN